MILTSHGDRFCSTISYTLSWGSDNKNNKLRFLTDTFKILLRGAMNAAKGAKHV